MGMLINLDQISKAKQLPNVHRARQTFKSTKQPITPITPLFHLNNLFVNYDSFRSAHFNTRESMMKHKWLYTYKLLFALFQRDIL